MAGGARAVVKTSVCWLAGSTEGREAGGVHGMDNRSPPVVCTQNPAVPVWLSRRATIYDDDQSPITNHQSTVQYKTTIPEDARSGVRQSKRFLLLSFVCIRLVQVQGGSEYTAATNTIHSSSNEYNTHARWTCTTSFGGTRTGIRTRAIYAGSWGIRRRRVVMGR